MNGSIAFRANANRARPKDRMCTGGMTRSPPKNYAPSQSSHASRRAQIMPKWSGPKPSQEGDNTNSQASGSVAHSRAFSTAHYRSFPITVELSAHPASRLFGRPLFRQAAYVPEFGV